MKTLIKGLLTSLIIGIGSYWTTTYAQTKKEAKTEYTYNQKNTPQGIDNYLFSTYYYNGKKTFNLRNLPLSNTSGEVISMKINPSGTSFALLTRSKSGITHVSIHDLWKSQKELHLFKNVVQPTGICYTPDAKSLLIATAKEVTTFDARTYIKRRSMHMPFAAHLMVMSPNGYYLAATDGTRLIVWNMESKSIRKEFEMGVKINSIAFSDDNNTFAVLTYAWGETEEKGDYSIETYKFCNGTEYSFTKYCSDSSYGKVDNKKDSTLLMMWHI